MNENRMENEMIERPSFMTLVAERWKFLLGQGDVRGAEHPEITLVTYGELQMAMLTAFEAGVVAGCGKTTAELYAERTPPDR